MNARGIEQDRRDFKREHPALYQYILDHEIAKVWDSAGDTVSGISTMMANTFWRRSSQRAQRAREAREASQVARPARGSTGTESPT